MTPLHSPELTVKWLPSARREREEARGRKTRRYWRSASARRGEREIAFARLAPKNRLIFDLESSFTRGEHAHFMSETTEVTVEFGCCLPCRLVAHKCNKLRFPSLQITVGEGGDGGRRTYYKRCKMLPACSGERSMDESRSSRSSPLPDYIVRSDFLIAPCP